LHLCQKNRLEKKKKGRKEEGERGRKNVLTVKLLPQFAGIRPLDCKTTGQK
jgi:hypothetical protein